MHKNADTDADTDRCKLAFSRRESAEKRKQKQIFERSAEIHITNKCVKNWAPGTTPGILMSFSFF